MRGWEDCAACLPVPVWSPTELGEFQIVGEPIAARSVEDRGLSSPRYAFVIRVLRLLTDDFGIIVLTAEDFSTLYCLKKHVGDIEAFVMTVEGIRRELAFTCHHRRCGGDERYRDGLAERVKSFNWWLDPTLVRIGYELVNEKEEGL